MGCRESKRCRKQSLLGIVELVYLAVDWAEVAAEEKAAAMAEEKAAAMAEEKAAVMEADRLRAMLSSST